MIDEATGTRRSRYSATIGDYLQRRLDPFLRDQTDRWQQRFSASLVHALAPLYGVRYTGGSYPRELFRAFGMICEYVLGDDRL